MLKVSYFTVCPKGGESKVSYFTVCPKRGESKVSYFTVCPKRVESKLYQKYCILHCALRGVRRGYVKSIVFYGVS